MKINNTEDIMEYPENYDNWTEEQKDVIIKYMNAVQHLCDEYYQKHLNSESLNNTQEHQEYLSLYRHTLTSLTGSKNAYATLGLKVEYNWPNHKHEWFLATRQDAEEFLNAPDDPYPDSCDIPDDTEQKTNKILDYGDVVN